MLNRFKIRKVTENDTDAVINLINKVFNLHRDREWFYYVHYKNPGGKSILWIAENEDGEIVSFRSIIMWPLLLKDGVILKCGQLADAATDKRYRGKGLYSEVHKKAESQFWKEEGRILFSFPSPKNQEILTKRFGYKELSNIIPRGYVHLIPKNMITRRTKIGDKKILINEKDAEKILDKLNIKLEDPSSIDIEYKRSSGFIFNQDILQWRLKLPGRKYKIFKMDKENYLITGDLTRRGLRLCTMIDYHYSNHKNILTLIKALNLYAKRAGFDAVYTWKINNCPFMLSLGFLPRYKKTPLVVKTRNVISYDLIDEVRLIYTDAY